MKNLDDANNADGKIWGTFSKDKKCDLAEIEDELLEDDIEFLQEDFEIFEAWFAIFHLISIICVL